MTANGNGNSVGTVTDDLIAKARAIANRSDELLHLLEDARQKLLNGGRKPEQERRFKPAEPISIESTPEAPPKVPAPPEISDGLRLLTTQMTMSGASREEIAAWLTQEFGIADPEAILRQMGL
jgi:hypothetical protein